MSGTDDARDGRVRMQWNLKISLRDGVQLSATLYLPPHHSSRSCVIFTPTPYVAQAHHDLGVYFASHGYPFLTVDVRGRGNSQGEFHPATEGRDGHDVVEWIARQSYCDGQVAMWGGSYAGYVQWVVAKERPAHLKTIVPVAAPYRGVDSPVRNNIFVPYTMQWLTLISGRTSQEKMVFDDRSFWATQFRHWFEEGAPFKTLDAFVGNPSRLFQEWLAHPQQDEYWDSYNPTHADYAKLSLPILTITGAYDANQAGALMHYRQYMASASAAGQARHFLVIGPWDHAGTRAPKSEFAGLKVGAPSLVDLRQLHVEWYAWTMRGGPRPQFLRKNVAYYVTGADEWCHADTLAEVTSHSMPLYLHSSLNPTDAFHSGLLSEDRPGPSAPDHYVYDPSDISLAKFESTVDPEDLVDQRMIHASVGRQLVYHSAPLTQSLDIGGFFRFSVWLSIDQPDTDFRVAVYEITPAGGSILLAMDSMRARYRESLREPKLVQTSAPLRYDFERFSFVARRIGIASRLRLVIGPINSIYGQKNYNSGGVVADESISDARAVTVRLFHDEARPSALYVPIGRPATRESFT